MLLQIIAINSPIISWIWDYTVLSHFQCFSKETRIVNMKVVAHESGPEVYVIIRPETIPWNTVGFSLNVCNLS
jgi:hypothetical protein